MSPLFCVQRFKNIAENFWKRAVALDLFNFIFIMTRDLVSVWNLLISDRNDLTWVPSEAGRCGGQKSQILSVGQHIRFCSLHQCSLLMSIIETSPQWGECFSFAHCRRHRMFYVKFTVSFFYSIFKFKFPFWRKNLIFTQSKLETCSSG